METKIQTTNERSAGQGGHDYGSANYRTFVLLWLTLVYALNFIDRILITVVGRPIIEEFNLSNFQFGLLTGFAFAVFYTFLGIPIAHWSERTSRVKIIGFSIILWSAATALCGLTAGFMSLLFARIIVGVGEAGSTPPSNSLICDYYKPNKRPGALGIYAMGSLLGGFLAYLFGGLFIQSFSWRETFIYLGLPGILIGLVVLLAIKEPPRGYSDPDVSSKLELTTLKEALLELKRKPTFWFVTLAVSVSGFAAYSFTSFQPLYIQYNFDVSPGIAAIYYMAPLAFAGAVGSMLSGFLIQRLSKRINHASIWVSSLTLLASVPFLLFGYMAGSKTVMLSAFLLGTFFQYFYIGASFDIVQSVTSQRVRATAIAVLLLFTNLIGYGFGPPLTGALADMFTGNFLHSLPLSNGLDGNCNPRNSDLSSELIQNCIDSKAHGARWSMSVTTLTILLASFFMFMSLKTIDKDKNI